VIEVNCGARAHEFAYGLLISKLEDYYDRESAHDCRGRVLSKTVSEKILSKYIVGELVKGEEIELQITHTLIQDSTGTMADLQFEAMRVPTVKTELSVSFVDHNMLQGDHKNMDDHKYLQSVAAKHGLYYSRPGNGICHQVFLERFSKPGKTLLGSDSHTTSAGGAGMIAIGAGGLDVAAAMAGEKYTFALPEELLTRS
jgi:aconitate hydratase